MSLLADESIVDRSSTYEVSDAYLSNNNHITTLTNYENTMNNDTNVNNLINRIMSIVDEHLDDAQECKNMFNKNALQPAFYQILCEIKDKIGKSIILEEKFHQDVFFSCQTLYCFNKVKLFYFST